MESTPLRINIDSSDARVASDNLNRLSNTSRSTETQIQRLGSGFIGLKSAIAGLGAAQAAQYFIKTADSMNLLNARLKLTTDSLEEYNSQQKELLSIAKGSYTALSDTITLYTKLDPALSKVGATTEQVNSVVDSFTKGLQLGGASAQESSSAILQFSQAMGSGVLRGEEFNAMAEASPKLMQYLAKGLDVPQTALRKMAENGELTALRVSNALLKMKGDIDRDFVTLPVTVAKATTNAMTELALGVSDIDNAIGITSSLASAINDLANNIGTYSQNIISFYQEANIYINEHHKGLTQVLAVVGSVAAAYLTFIAGGAVVAGIANITAAVGALRVAMLSLEASVPVLGWIAALVGVGAGIYISNMNDIDEATKINIKTTEDGKAALEALALQRKAISEDKFMLNSDQKKAEEAIDAQSEAIRMQTIALRENKLARSEVGNIFGDTNNQPEAILRANKPKETKTIDSTPIRNETEIIKLAGTEYQKFQLTLDEHIKKLKEANATEKEINDYRLKATQEFNEKQSKDSIQEAKKKNDELLKLEKEHQENIKKVTQDAKDMITSDIQKLANEYVEMYAVVKDTLSEDELNRLNEAYQKKAEDITGVTELIKQAQDIATSEIDKINDKYMQMYEVIKDNPMFDEEKMKLFYKKWNEEIENTKDKLDFTKSIELDTTGDNRAVAKITKGFDELNDATKQYADNKLKAGNDTAKLAQNEEQYRKDQINGYANISSAMADMFEKGSKEAATFQAASTALALVEATRAILTQGTGDPYTAIPRMVAMAAMVGSLMKNIGVAFGMNKTSTSSDAFSAQTANTGTGTTLGDTKKASDSIKNSLSILEDFAKPQFRLATSMDTSLKSIDSKIGGVTRLLLQNSATALGTNYTGAFNTGFKNNLTTVEGAAGSILLGVLNPVMSLSGGTSLDKLINKIPLVGDLNKGLGSVINSAIGGLFGKTSVSQGLTDSGIYFADTLLQSAIKEFNGQAFQTIETTVSKKSWFSKSSSTSISSYFSDLDAQVSNQFSLVLSNIYDTVYKSGQALDIGSTQLENSLNSFVVSIGKISLYGKTGTQIQEVLTNVFSQISDKLSSATVPVLSEFQGVGEGTYETLIRVATGMEQANYFIDRLGSTFEKINFTDIINKQGVIGFEALYQSIMKIEKGANFNEIVSSLSGTAEELYTAYLSLDLIRDRLTFFGKGLDALGISIISGAGGLESLSDGISSYIENFYSDAEQQSLKIIELNQLLNRAGISTVPNSIAGFRKLIESIDTTTESGQYLYGNLLSLNGAFSDVYSEIDSNRTSLLSDITDFVKELRGTTSTLNTGTTFKTFANSFNEMIDAIANGSSNLSEIGATTLTTAQSYLDTVAKTASTSQELQFAKQIVANKLESVTKAPNIDLGTINETLKISFNENSVIVNELKAMKEQLVYLNGLNTTQAATQLKTLSATRALIS